MSKKPIHLESRDDAGELRLSSPSAGRNSAIIAEVLKTHMPENARVLEIASGTGEHAVAACTSRPDIVWQTSDPDERSRQSQDAWCSECPGQISKSLEINTMASNWWADLGQFDAVFCANMIHIAPWEAALGIANSADHILSDGGLVILYGPYLEGVETAESNLRFDQNLKARNIAWGVRSLDSVKHIFADVGFNLQARLEMPKENRILIFSRL